LKIFYYILIQEKSILYPIMIPIRDWLEPHDAEYIDGLKELLENGHEEYETPLMIAVEPTDFIIEINHNKLYAHQEKIATLSPALNKKMKQYKEWKIKKLVQKSSKSTTVMIIFI